MLFLILNYIDRTGMNKVCWWIENWQLRCNLWALNWILSWHFDYLIKDLRSSARIWSLFLILRSRIPSHSMNETWLLRRMMHNMHGSLIGRIPKWIKPICCGATCGGRMINCRESWTRMLFIMMHGRGYLRVGYTPRHKSFRFFNVWNSLIFWKFHSFSWRLQVLIHHLRRSCCWKKLMRKWSLALKLTIVMISLRLAITLNWRRLGVSN